MKNIKKIIYAICIMCLIATFFVEVTPVSATGVSNDSKITITSKTKTLKFTNKDKGTKFTIKVKGQKGNKVYDKEDKKWYNLEWSSSNKNIATVDKNGKVKIVGKKCGTAVINVGYTYGTRPKFFYTVSDIKIVVNHNFTVKKTEHKEPTLYAPGGDYTYYNKCGCGKSKAATVKNKKDFVYTEDIVLQEMDNILNWQMDCPLITDEFGYGGFKSARPFVEWLIERGTLPKSFADRLWETTATKKGTDSNYIHIGMCEDAVHAMEVCLSYQDYQLIHGSGAKDGFDYSKDLKPGDILKYDEGDHVVMFWQYTDYEDGEVGFDTLTGCDGFINSEHFFCDPTGKSITKFTLRYPAVYRLPNYKF